MFEWHGWATVDTSQEQEEQVRRLLAEAGGIANETVDSRWANGMLQVWLAGSHNHRDESVIELFRSIAELAPDSYGVLYALEHGVGTRWDRWVMQRGSVVLEPDTSLYVD